jgi:hypothetical protein
MRWPVCMPRRRNELLLSRRRKFEISIRLIPRMFQLVMTFAEWLYKARIVGFEYCKLFLMVQVFGSVIAV